MSRTPYYDENDPRQNPTGAGTEDPEMAAARAAADRARGASVDTSAVQFGNRPGGAEASRDQALNQTHENDASQRSMDAGQGWLNGQSTGFGQQASEDPRLANNFAGGANGNQAGAIELARRQALGQGGPSQGAMQLQQGLNQGSAQQSAMAAGARGSASLATAGANQRANTSNLQQNAYTGAGILKSQDMAAGRGMYGTMADQQRQQSDTRLGQANQMGQDNAKRADDYQLGTAGAAIGMGQVGNRLNNQDLTGVNRSMESINAQDDSNQDYQVYLANKRRTEEANYQEDHK